MMGSGVLGRRTIEISNQNSIFISDLVSFEVRL